MNTTRVSTLSCDELAEIVVQLNECSFPRWFDAFEKIAIRGVWLEIPKDVVGYLRDEIVVLPKECYPSGNSDTVIEFTTSDFPGANDDDSEDDEIRQPEYPEFSKRITKSIAQLKGGVAFLKTNWHCPKDAYWITAGQTLRVKDITDVYQLLKASSIVKQDLCHHGLPDNVLNPQSQLVDVVTDKHFLVLKEWHEIHPGTEFRCFVRRRNLIAISPRDWPAYHKHVVQQKNDIRMDIRSTFRERIKEQFPLDSFVFDVIRAAKDVILLVDFSPFNELVTDPLAFDWKELTDEQMFQEEDDPEFRYLPNDCGIQPSKRNNYGVPIDIIDMFSGICVDFKHFTQDLALAGASPLGKS